MGLDFVIIDESDKIIASHHLGWLNRNYDINFCDNYKHSTIINIIKYCDKEINKLHIQKKNCQKFYIV